MADKSNPMPIDPTEEETIDAEFASELAAEITEEMTSWAAQAAEVEAAPEVKVTVRGALGRKRANLKVRTTLRSDGRVAVKVSAMPSHKESMPAFLIPNAMEPASADVGTHRTRDALKAAKVKAVVKILCKAWIRIGVEKLRDLFPRAA